MSQAIGIISKLRHFTSSSTCLSVYNAIFFSQLHYGCLVWQFTSKLNIAKLKNIQKKCIRIITFSDFKDCTNIPECLKRFFVLNQLVHTQETRSKTAIHIPPCFTSYYGKNSLRFKGAVKWNEFYKSVLYKNRFKSVKTFKEYFKKLKLKAYLKIEQN